MSDSKVIIFNDTGVAKHTRVCVESDGQRIPIRAISVDIKTLELGGLVEATITCLAELDLTVLPENVTIVTQQPSKGKKDGKLP